MDPKKFNKQLRKIKDDKEAIVPIYREYYSEIVIHLRCRFGKLICHEDIAQEVFAALLEPREYKEIASPTQWLFAIADNKAIDCLRSRHEEIAYADTLDSGRNFDYSYLSAEVQFAFEQIDALSRTILHLRFWEGYNHKEIAAMLHMSCGNVRLKVSRAYQEIKKYL